MSSQSSIIVTPSQLFALIIRRIKLILLCALIGMLLIAGLYIVKNGLYNSTAVNEDVNDLELNQKEPDLKLIQKELDLELSQRELEALISGRESISSFYLSSIEFSLGLENGSNQINDLENSVTAFLSRYNAGDKTDQVFFSTEIVENDLLSVSIFVYADSPNKAFSIANSVFEELRNNLDTKWEIFITHKTVSSSSMANDQTSEVNGNRLKLIYDFNAAIEKKTIEIEKLKAEIEVMKSEALSDSSPNTMRQIIKYSIVGFVFGGFIAVFCVVVKFLFSVSITSSFEMERKLDIPFLGAMFIRNGLSDGLSRRILGERNLEKDSLSLLIANIDSHVFPYSKGAKVALVSSCNLKKLGDVPEKVLSAFKENGFEPTIMGDCLSNAETNVAVKNADVVVLLERQWVSKWMMIDSEIDLVSRFEKPVGGFIIC